MFGLKIKSAKSLTVKLLIVFIPVYLVAYTTQSMAYVLPTIAVFLIYGASMPQNDPGGRGEVSSEEENESDAVD
ncbi:MAG: hypothetical protein CL573_01230 [Alphaproteobacteria bacterium]|nr:hypothetical protein [Alphaproteobacteria bacterium]